MVMPSNLVKSTTRNVLSQKVRMDGGHGVSPTSNISPFVGTDVAVGGPGDKVWS